MTEQELKEIEDRANAATPGPWNLRDYSVFSDSGACLVDHVDPLTRESSFFIAYARTDVPNLLAEVKRLRVDNARLRGLLKAVEFTTDDTYVTCAHCGNYVSTGYGTPKHHLDCPAFTPDGEVK